MSGQNRREFIKKGALAALVLPIIASIQGLEALATPAKKVEPKVGGDKKDAGAKKVELPAGETATPESDPVANALGYKENAKGYPIKTLSQKPKTKNPTCSTCSLYTKRNEGWGKCTMIQNGVVSAAGLCRSYTAK